MKILGRVTANVRDDAKRYFKVKRFTRLFEKNKVDMTIWRCSDIA